MDPLNDWPTFIDAIRARLEAGRLEYGDRSFDADPAELRREISEELQDVCAWSFIMWRRLQAASCSGGCEQSRALRARCQELERRLDELRAALDDVGSLAYRNVGPQVRPVDTESDTGC